MRFFCIINFYAIDKLNLKDKLNSDCYNILESLIYIWKYKAKKQKKIDGVRYKRIKILDIQKDNFLLKRVNNNTFKGYFKKLEEWKVIKFHFEKNGKYEKIFYHITPRVLNIFDFNNFTGKKSFKGKIQEEILEEEISEIEEPKILQSEEFEKNEILQSEEKILQSEEKILQSEEFQAPPLNNPPLYNTYSTNNIHRIETKILKNFENSNSNSEQLKEEILPKEQSFIALREVKEELSKRGNVNEKELKELCIKKIKEIKKREEFKNNEINKIKNINKGKKSKSKTEPLKEEEIRAVGNTFP